MSVAFTPRTERVPIARLHPTPHNPRTIRDARFEQLKRSLAADPELLDARPIIALPNGEVVAGNMRLRAALALGWDAVPCITVDLDARRAREWMLKDNNAYGEWQADDLAALVYDLGQQGADLATLGFDEAELQRLLDSTGANGTDPAEAACVDSIPQQWMVLIQCADETQQATLLERLTGEGLTCRALLS